MIHPVIPFFPICSVLCNPPSPHGKLFTYPFGTIFLFSFLVTLNHFTSWDLTKTFLSAVNLSIPFTIPVAQQHLPAPALLPNSSFLFLHLFSLHVLPVSFWMYPAFCSLFSPSLEMTLEYFAYTVLYSNTSSVMGSFPFSVFRDNHLAGTKLSCPNVRENIHQHAFISLFISARRGWCRMEG